MLYYVPYNYSLLGTLPRGSGRFFASLRAVFTPHHSWPGSVSRSVWHTIARAQARVNCLSTLACALGPCPTMSNPVRSRMGSQAVQKMTIASNLPAEAPPAPLLCPPYTDWQAALADAVTDLAELTRLLRLTSYISTEGAHASGQFRLLVPRSYLARIRPGEPADPLLLQVLPSGEELVGTPGFSEDPLAETEAMREPGLLAKYAGRVLMVTTGACGVHCRFCFRRHFPYQDPAAGPCSSESDGSAGVAVRANSAAAHARGSRTTRHSPLATRRSPRPWPGLLPIHPSAR